MDTTPSHRPRVSRETRLLLTTALVAAAALWVLARIRFPDLPASPNSVPPLLSQLAGPPALESLASQVFQVQGRLESSLMAIDASSPRSTNGGTVTSARVTALRLRDDLAVAVVPKGPTGALTSSGRVEARDPPSGLIVLRVSLEASGPSLAHWTPTRLERPQFLLVSDGSTPRITLRPVFVSSLEPQANALWADPIWRISQSSDIAPGSFVFTTAGELVGVVIEYAARSAIVPSTTLLAEVERLIAQPITPAEDLGVRVQVLTSDLAAATGATGGVVVTWVDPVGPAASVLAAADVIEAVDGQAVPTPDVWSVRVARIGAGTTLTLQVHRQGEVRDVTLRAPGASSAASNGRLGLRMRRVPRSGSELIGVEPGSVGALAGLAAGDVITLIGAVPSPTPVQVQAAFTSAPKGKAILVAVTRRATHFVTTLTR
jgi:PDZ domain